MEYLSHSKNRFELSNIGWRRMNAGRDAYELVREAVANAFDQDDVTSINVKIEAMDIGGTQVVIEDNSVRGIEDPSLVSTVFMTDKGDSPKKRGRKGRGLKELISAADHATIDTVGHRIEFAEGRTVYSNTRKQGTSVSVYVSDWGLESRHGIRSYLFRMIPPLATDLYIDGIRVAPKRVRTVLQADLEAPCVIDGVQINQTHNTAVNITNLAKGETEGWLYEMGVPVQSIKTKFHIDVQQRIPLNDNRTTVDSYYLKVLYGLCLKHLMPSLSRGALKQEWATLGIGYADVDVMKEFVRKMFGSTTANVIKSYNKQSNDVVQQHGMQLIDTDGMPWSVEEALKKTLRSADMVAASIDASDVGKDVQPHVADPHGKATALIRYLGQEVLGRDLTVRFFERGAIFTGKMRLADFNPETLTIRFNVAAGFNFNNPINPELLSTICHEFGHMTTIHHDAAFHDAVSKISGMVSTILWTKRAEVAACIGRMTKPAGTGRAES